MNDEDKSLIRRLYNLTDCEVIEAEKLHMRAGFSICGAAKAVAEKGYRHRDSRRPKTTILALR